MPRPDTLHNTVRDALIKDGWNITHDPLHLRFGGMDTYIDLGAELPPLTADKDGKKIAVKIKSFRGVSEITELERALGQLMIYRFLLRRRDPERTLYLAVPSTAYNSIFSTRAAMELLPEEQILLLVVNPETEEIERWMPIP